MLSGVMPRIGIILQQNYADNKGNTAGAGTVH